MLMGEGVHYLFSRRESQVTGVGGKLVPDGPSWDPDTQPSWPVGPQGRAGTAQPHSSKAPSLVAG